MNAKMSLKRRVLYTGLSPFLPEGEVIDAIHYWESHVARTPNFTLQCFVADVCQRQHLNARRAEILLHLVQALQLPVRALLPDPLPDDNPSNEDLAGIKDTRACTALLETVMVRAPLMVRRDLRLDLLASLSPRRLPAEIIHPLVCWLENGDALLLPSVPLEALRGLINRTYVLLCERIGPDPADRLLAEAINQVQGRQPELREALQVLL